MRVDVTVDKSGKHPHFFVKCHGKDGQIWETKRRFAAFRDFRDRFVLVQPDLIKAEFPPTIASSAYGIQLSEKQLSERRSLLHNWLQEIVDEYDQLATDDLRLSLYRLLRGDSSSFQISLDDKSLSQVEFARSARKEQVQTTNTSTPPKDGPASRSLTAMLSLRGSSNQLSDAAPLPTPPAKDVVLDAPVSVRVSRGTMDGGHNTYETIVHVGCGHRPFVVTKYFKDYRQLALDLRQDGIAVGSVDRDDYNCSCGRGDGPHDLPAFPPSYKRSQVGLPLDEETVSKRCRGLDSWVRAVLRQYHTFAPGVQAVIDRFLTLREDSTNPVIVAILNSLRSGNVVATSSIPPLTSAPSSAAIPSEKAQVNAGQVDSNMTAPTDGKPVRRGSLMGKLLSRKHIDGETVGEGSGAVSGNSISRGKKGSKERAIADAEEAERRELQRKKMEEDNFRDNHTLKVGVIRGSSIGGHPSYELKITYQKETPPYVVSKKFFKDFRQLALEVSNQGLHIRGIDQGGGEGVDSLDKTGSLDVSAAVAQTGSPLNAVEDSKALPPFPRTFRRSSLGLSLPEADLQSRCQGLDKWMRALLWNYHSYSPSTQSIVNHFLEIDVPQENPPQPPHHSTILRSLSRGYVDPQHGRVPLSGNTLSGSESADDLSSAAAVPPAPTVSNKTTPTSQNTPPIVPTEATVKSMDNHEDGAANKACFLSAEGTSTTVRPGETAKKKVIVKSEGAAGENAVVGEEDVGDWMEITSIPKNTPTGCVPSCVIS